MACLEGRNFTIKLYPQNESKFVVSLVSGQFEIPPRRAEPVYRDSPECRGEHFIERRNGAGRVSA